MGLFQQADASLQFTIKHSEIHQASHHDSHPSSSAHDDHRICHPPFKSPLPPHLSDDPTLHPLLQNLSAWQSECSGYPLRFFTHHDPSRAELYLVTGWASVAVHEAWIRGERNQELLRVFAPYVDIAKVRMVHLDLDFEAIPEDKNDDGTPGVIIERYCDPDGAVGRTLLNESESERSDGTVWLLVGRDLAQECGNVYRFVGYSGNGEPDVGRQGGTSTVPPVERWVLKRIEV